MLRRGLLRHGAHRESYKDDEYSPTAFHGNPLCFDPGQLDASSPRRYGIRDGATLRPMIAQDLLEILVCPECKKPLTYRPETDTLKCEQCRRVFPVRDDIPVLLLDEATLEP